MSWSQQMREARRARGGQMDWLDDPVLSYKLVCDGTDPLTNRMVTARGRHRCSHCAEPNAEGWRIRAESRRSADGKTIETRRVCPTCCGCIEAYMRAARPGIDPGAAAERAAIDVRHEMGEAATALLSARKPVT